MPPVSASFSPSGRYLALAHRDAVRLYDVLTGEELPPLVAHIQGAMGVRFSNDGKLFTIGFDKKGVLVNDEPVINTELLTWSVAKITQPLDSAPPKLTPDTIAALCAKVASASAWERYVAAQWLLSDKVATLAAVRERVQPVPPLSTPAANAIAQKLNSDDYNTRRAALQEVGPHGEQVINALLALTPKSRDPRREAEARIIQRFNRPQPSPEDRVLRDAIDERRPSAIASSYPTAQEQAQAKLAMLLPRIGSEEARLHAAALAKGYAGSNLASTSQLILAEWDAIVPKAPRDWPGLWAALASDKGIDAFAALSQLALEWPQHQAQAQAEVLRLSHTPALGDRATLVRALALQLDDDEYQKRENATLALKQLGRAIQPQLRGILAEASSPEAIRRLQDILDTPIPTRPNASQRLILRVLEASRLSGKDNREMLRSISKECGSDWLKEELRREIADSPTAWSMDE